MSAESTTHIFRDIVFVLIPVLLTTFFGTGFLVTDYFIGNELPNIIISLTIDRDNKTGSLEINNFGTSSANNFSLLFKSPENITEITNVFSIDNISIKDLNNEIITLETGDSLRIDSNILEFNITKLSHGIGSINNILVSFDSINNQTAKNLKIVGKYNEGSTIGIIFPELYTIDFFHYFLLYLGYYFYKSIFLVGFILFVIVFLLVISYKWILSIRSRQNRKNMLINNLTALRIVIKHNLEKLISDTEMFEKLVVYYDNIFIIKEPKIGLKKSLKFLNYYKKIKYERDHYEDVYQQLTKYEIIPLLSDLQTKLNVLRDGLNVLRDGNSPSADDIKKDSIDLIDRILSEINKHKKILKNRIF